MRLIANRGYYPAIDELLGALNNLTEILSADPMSYSKERELRLWARAVKGASKRHIDEGTFEQRLDALVRPAQGKGNGHSVELRVWLLGSLTRHPLSHFSRLLLLRCFSPLTGAFVSGFTDSSARESRSHPPINGSCPTFKRHSALPCAHSFHQ